MLHQTFKRAAKRHRSRARRYGVPSTLTAGQLRRIVRRYGRCCLACGAPQSEVCPLTVDHVLPMVKGGPNIAANVQPLCCDCNQRKGAEVIDYRPGSRALIPLRFAPVAYPALTAGTILQEIAL